MILGLLLSSWDSCARAEPGAASVWRRGEWVRTRYGSYWAVGFVAPRQLGRGVWDPGAIPMGGTGMAGQVLVGTEWTKLLLCLNGRGFSEDGSRVRHATF